MSKTRRFLHPAKENHKLDALLRRAVAAFDALSPEEKREHMRAQRKSWVIGEMLLENPEMTREEAARIYDEVTL